MAFLAGAACVVLVASASAPAQDVSPMLVKANQKLAAQRANVRVATAEYITAGTGAQIGRIIYASNRDKQLGADWVPGDPNRDGRTDITWINDTKDGDATGAPTAADTQAAVERAMNTWEDVTCSTIPLSYLGSYYFDFGYVQYLLGYGGVRGWAADITHAGWLPVGFFNAIAPPDGGTYILGVTFTFIWVDDVTGDPTDIDGNGKQDVAFRETYYNNAFTWKIDGTFDVETIVLHETGHGLSQGHFGDIFRTTSNGKLHFAPRAVMNAAYSGVQQELTGTDIGGHCSIWASWPNQ
jgi:hypothetical protein